MVADDQPSFRRATAAAVSTLDGFVMAGVCVSGEDAVDRVRERGADLLLMDIHMPGMGGIEAARLIHAAHPGVVIVLMSTYDAEDLPAGAAACGASSYVRKEQLGPDALLQIWRAHR